MLSKSIGVVDLTLKVYSSFFAKKIFLSKKKRTIPLSGNFQCQHNPE
jgi:hypothetical protein